MKKNHKLAAIFCFCGSALSLAVGASFHGLRMQQDDQGLFALGVIMGIVMLAISTACIAAGIILLVKHRKHGGK